MVVVSFDSRFKRAIHKIKNRILKEKIKKQIKKIIASPEIGKPMRYTRKRTREVRIPPFRLSYAYIKNEDKIVFLELYHKDKQ